MKTSFKLVHIIACLVLADTYLAVADTADQVGYLRLVNAIAEGSGNVSVLVDGDVIYPKGYRFGAVTGGIGLLPGVHKVMVLRKGVRKAILNVTVIKNLTISLVAHAEEIPAKDGTPALYQARLMALTPRDVPKGKVATFVSVSRTPLLPVDLRGPDGKWKSVEVPHLGSIETPILSGRGYVALRSGGRPLDAIPVAEPGNYVVVLLDGPKGALHSVSFRDCGEVTGD